MGVMYSTLTVDDFAPTPTAPTPRTRAAPTFATRTTTTSTATSPPPSEMPETSFQDTSTECGICLSPYADEPDKTVIQLACGHQWHLDCVKEQLQHARPNYAQRLVFSGCRCAKCGQVCEHPALDDLTRPTDALRVKVDQMIKEQLQIDHDDDDAADGYVANPDLDALMDHGRRVYAFYLCSSCNEPYFGGTVDCADELQGERATSQDRLCPCCTPQTVCPHPVQHRGSYKWKCRYCCQPASYICYGSIHFCHSCHERNSQRYRQQQQQSNLHNRRQRQLGPPLQPIPCPGAKCPFPKPSADTTHHKNGSDASCEQVYECTICQSAPQIHDELLEEPGSENLLTNPCGQSGLTGWRQLNPRMAWQAETSEIPIHPDRRTNFVSSFDWCVMVQFVDLTRLVRNPSSVSLQVSAKYMGRHDCPSVFCLEAVVLDRQPPPPRQQAHQQAGRVLYRTATALLDAPADFWEGVSLTLPPTPGAVAVAVIVKGKDSKFWRGLYGSKVTNISLRVLGSNLADIML